ncbi:NAD-binding protein [Rathayibacter sp. VKM Ac-2857]|uniref:NAD-binding protein n=1 Tax=Rathayibacter sp. VKM Ac-2857 TaxID=2739020 RepID=UPI001563CDB5|nr:NAD-binding protein [Rathayibacter sp. VKM Ac-2857]NQX17143.1 NAD-binding protein [Rathayibacter sp. VKM Ac-2857]
MHATLTPLRRAVPPATAADATGDSRVVRALSRTAWAQAVLRAVAAASNLSFAHTRVAVLGTGPLAVELATRTAAMGARVVVVGDDPVALVEIAQLGVTVQTAESAELRDATIAFATGERPEPVVPALLGGGGPLLLVDAAEELPAVTAVTDPSSGRPGIDRIVDAERELFLLVARDVADGSARRTREQLSARFAAAVDAAREQDPSPDDLHDHADRALALELLR